MRRGGGGAEGQGRKEGEGAGGDGVERGSADWEEGKEGSVNRVPLF